MKIIRIAAVICLMLVFLTTSKAQQWTKQAAKKWVEGRDWAKGANMKVNKSINDVEFAMQYHINKVWWDEAFAFLNDPKLDTLKPGKYVIEGDNVYAMVTEGPTKDFDKSAWESHRNYIDLHYVIRGKEKIGVTPVALATITNPYDVAKDIANYTADGKFYDAGPGELFLFFPTDAHRPGIKTAGFDTDKKLVIKIKYTLSNP